MIVGICGLINSGKNTVGELLVSRGFKEESFAKSLKDSIAVIFSWDRELLEGKTEESRIWRETPDVFWSEKFEKEITPRYILQTFGTNVVRDNLLDSIWINSLEKRIKDSSSENIVLTDVRFPNEIEFIKNMGGYVIQVARGDAPVWWSQALRDNYEGQNNMKTLYPDIHESEYSWARNPNIDFIIYNHGTLKDLDHQVSECLDHLTLDIFNMI